MFQLTKVSGKTNLIHTQIFEKYYFQFCDSRVVYETTLAVYNFYCFLQLDIKLLKLKLQQDR